MISMLPFVQEYMNISELVFKRLVISGLILLFYFPAKWIMARFIKTKFSSEKHSELLTDVIPAFIKYLILAVLLKVWTYDTKLLSEFSSIDETTIKKIISSVLVYLYYLLIKTVCSGFVNFKYHDDVLKQYTLRRSFFAIIGTLLFAALFKIWIVTGADLTTYLGLVSAGLAIALQDVIVSIVAWFYILMVRPFNIGDRVQIGDHKGDITDIKVFQFSILETGNWVKADQATGRILHFPNSFIFKNAIANYNSGFDYIFTEIPIMITFESNWKKALKILEEILNSEVGSVEDNAIRQIKKASRHMRLNFVHLSPRVISSVADSGVVLTLRFLCKIKERRIVEQGVWKAILLAFESESDIDFAYPTQRFYVNNVEGKTGAGGPKENIKKEEK